MSHAKNKIEWCLKKAETELKTSNKHRGLININPDLEKAKKHIKKAEHNLELMIYLRNSKYSDWCSSAAFYSAYHCLLAIISKFGYESRNQECTFALIFYLIETKKINMDKKLIEKIYVLEAKEVMEATTTEIREQYQYGTELSFKDDIFKEILDITKKILGKAKEIIVE